MPPAYLTEYFSGEQIDKYLKHHLNKSNSYYIGTYLTELLSSGVVFPHQIGLNDGNLSPDHTIYAAINTNNEHWFLFIANRHISFIIDPLVDSEYKNLGNIKAEQLLKTLKSEFNYLNKTQYDKNISINKLNQNNGFDCGPFVCGYAVNISFNIGLSHIDIGFIRETTCKLMAMSDTT